jgi:hypothetical protein
MLGLSPRGCGYWIRMNDELRSYRSSELIITTGIRARLALDKKLALLLFLSTNGVNSIAANQRGVGSAFYRRRNRALFSHN